jgi:Tfp pilus assembly protein PilF
MPVMNIASALTRRRASLPGALVLLAVGCGGGGPPPEAPSNPPLELLNTPNAPSTATPPAAGDDVAKGARALEANDLTSAKAYFDHALRGNPNNADALYYMGLLADKAGDKDGAEKSYKAALKARPDHEQAAVNLSALYIDGQRYEPALAVAQAGVAKHPNNGSLHMNAAVASAGKGDQPGATQEFLVAVRLAPDDPMFLLTYGHWLGVWKLSDAALTQLKLARPAAKKMGDAALGMLASIGHEMHVVGAWSDCVATYDEAIAIKDAAELRTERAACKSQAKDTAGALADLKAAIAQDASYAPAHYYLGNELARSGQFKAAIPEYETFLKLEPAGGLATAAQNHLKLAKAKAQGK